MTTRSLLVLALGLAAPACKKSPPPTVGTTCDAANDGKVVTLTAYLTTPTMVGACTDRCSVDLTDTGEYSGFNRIDLRVPVGTGPLTMKALPATPGLSTISAAALTVTDSDGIERPVGSRVTVRGTLSRRGGGCTLVAAEIHGAK